jgi:hypothetical protein
MGKIFSAVMGRKGREGANAGSVTPVTDLVPPRRHIGYIPAGNRGREVRMVLRNIGKTDRMVRILLGVAIAALGVAFRSWLGLIAIVPLATAAVGTCPLYLPFGLSTRKAS